MSAPNIPLYTFCLWIFWLPKGLHYTRNALPTTKVHAKHRDEKKEHAKLQHENGESHEKLTAVGHRENAEVEHSPHR